MPAASIRQNMSALQAKLKEIMPLAEDLSNIKIGAKNSDAKLAKLANKYPEWQFAISDLNSEDWKDKRDYLYKLFQQGSSLLEDLNNLKVNHEILYHLQLSSAERTSIQQRWANILSEKKRNVVVIDYPRYMQAIYDIINKPISSFDLTTRRGMAPLAFALAALSGRRMIEIMLQGEFSVAGKYTVTFLGQAKNAQKIKVYQEKYILFATLIYLSVWLTNFVPALLLRILMKWLKGTGKMILALKMVVLTLF